MSRSYKPVLCMAAISFLLTGCKTQAAPNEKTIRKSDNPAAWPFSTEEGVLKCEQNPKSAALAAVTFTTNNVKYGLNGGALTGDAFPDVDAVMVRNKVGLYTVPLGDLISQGLALCKNLPEGSRPVLF